MLPGFFITKEARRYVRDNDINWRFIKFKKLCRFLKKAEQIFIELTNRENTCFHLKNTSL